MPHVRASGPPMMPLKPDRASLMGLNDILWDEIAFHLPLQDYAALAATCT